MAGNAIQERYRPPQTGDAGISGKAFLSVADIFSSRSKWRSDQRMKASDCSLFEGQLVAKSLTTGIQMSAAKLKALRSSRHAAQFPKSVCLALSLEGETSQVDLGGGGVEVLKPGEIALFSFSDEIRFSGQFEEGQQTTSILIQLREDLIADDNLRDFVQTQTTQSHTTRLRHHPRMAELGRALLCQRQGGAIGTLMTESYALELVACSIAALRDDRREDRQQTDLRKMQRLRDYMIAHPERDHTLTALAQQAGMSASSLKNKFRAAFGMPVFSYLTELRMQHAKDGLARNGWSVKQAAFYAGYKHPANFSTAFKRRYGHCPGQVH